MYKLEILDNKGECIKVVYYFAKPHQNQINHLRMRYAKRLGLIPTAKLSHIDKNYVGSIIETVVS